MIEIPAWEFFLYLACWSAVALALAVGALLYRFSLAFRYRVDSLKHEAGREWCLSFERRWHFYMLPERVLERERDYYKRRYRQFDMAVKRRKEKGGDEHGKRS